MKNIDDMGLLSAMRASALVLTVGLGGALAMGCHSSPSPQAPRAGIDCREGPVEAAGRGVKTAGQGIEAGAETAVAGVKQGVQAAGGLLADGTEGAKEEWNEGKAETKGEAREGKAETKEASLPPCP